jgi:hypothetical protein
LTTQEVTFALTKTGE